MRRQPWVERSGTLGHPPCHLAPTRRSRPRLHVNPVPLVGSINMFRIHHHPDVGASTQPCDCVSRPSACSRSTSGHRSASVAFSRTDRHGSRPHPTLAQIRNILTCQPAPASILRPSLHSSASGSGSSPSMDAGGFKVSRAPQTGPVECLQPPQQSSARQQGFDAGHWSKEQGSEGGGQQGSAGTGDSGQT